MNKRVFFKEKLVLNLVHDTYELLRLLAKVKVDFKTVLPRVILFSDHMLDREFGYQAVKKAQEFAE